MSHLLLYLGLVSNEEYTLEELSQRTGVEARTLRSWVSEGLLSPPLKQGRGARYSGSNISRALAVRALKDLHGLSLTEISRRFLMASDEKISDWAAEASPTVSAARSARDYIRAIKGHTETTRRAQLEREGNAFTMNHASRPLTSYERTERGEADLASLERLILQLGKALEAPAPRRSRGTIWTRIPITRDLEVSVRGDLEPAERVLFEQLADQLRAILTGRSKHD